MNDTNIELAMNSVARAEQFRVKLGNFIAINRPTLNGEVYDMLSEAYSLTGNLQMHLTLFTNETLN